MLGAGMTLKDALRPNAVRNLFPEKRKLYADIKNVNLHRVQNASKGSYCFLYNIRLESHFLHVNNILLSCNSSSTHFFLSVNQHFGSQRQVFGRLSLTT